MIDRTIPPPFHLVDDIHIIQATSQPLDNGAQLHMLNAGTQDLLKIEITISAGNFYEHKGGASYFTAKMLGEGTKHYSSQELTRYIDQYGAFIDYNHGVDRMSVSLYTLSKHAEKLFPILREIITHSLFPEDELTKLQSVTLQNLQVNKQKNSYVASKKFRELLFGAEHPYGRNINEKIINGIQKEDLTTHFHQRILHAPFDLILVGKIGAREIKLANKFFGDLPINLELSQAHPNHTIDPSDEKLFVINKEDSLQSSLRLGQRIFNKNHPDYFKLMFTNEIFGGYFGSRLMRNIREDKGFTYGIYSNLIMFQRIGYWVIGSDVKKEFTEQTLEEIRKEAHKMQEELVDKQELETVRNYILGSFAGSISTPFDLADIFKSIYFNDLDYSFYDHYINAIKNMDAQTILETAREYLNFDNLLKVIVGGYQ